MRRFGALVRAGLRSNFGLSVLVHRFFREKKDRWYLPLIALGILGILPALYGYVRFVRLVFEILQPLGQERTILTFGCLIGQFLILIFGLYYVVSAFYFSRDLEMLIALPFKPREIMLSKFLIVLVNEYLTLAVILGPLFVTYGVLTRAGAGYALSAAAVYLLLPVIPLAAVSVLVVGMMRLANVSRKKDLMILVGSLFLIVLGMGIQFFVNRVTAARIDVGGLTGFFTSPNTLLARIGSGFPPAIWATKALAGGWSGEGLANLGALAGVSAALLFAMAAAAESLFFRGLIGIGEIAGRGKTLSRGELERRTAGGRRAVRAVFAREWRIMNRTPIFLLNGVLTAAIVPLVFLLMARAGRSGGPDILKAIGSAPSRTMALGGAAFMIISGCLNGTASSTFSREGAQFWLSKVIPVSAREQVVAKFLHSYLVALFGFAAAGLVLVLGLGVGPGVLALAAALSLVAGVALTAVAMIIDLARPLLDWTNPMKAIKQNLNVLFGIFADLGVLAIVGGLALLLAKAGLDGPALVAFLFAALAAAAVVSVRLLLAFAERRYGEIEI